MPDARDKRLAAEVVAALALFRQFALDHVLGGDPGVVGARLPQRVVALHPARPHDNVVEGDVEGVAEMELAGDVGRGNYDREDGTGARRVGLEIAEVNPALIPVLFRTFRIESLA